MCIRDSLEPCGPLVVVPWHTSEYREVRRHARYPAWRLEGWGLQLEICSPWPIRGPAEDRSCLWRVSGRNNVTDRPTGPQAE
eukprot:5210478-Alexandrium_andersonii.AAC.1